MEQFELFDFLQYNPWAIIAPVSLWCTPDSAAVVSKFQLGSGQHSNLSCGAFGVSLLLMNTEFGNFFIQQFG